MRSQDIEIPEPCHADWDAMRPEERGRFCFECKTKVHDLSAMTRSEAEVFLERVGCEDICISYEHEEDGSIAFREPRPAPIVPLSRLSRPRPRRAAAAVAGAGLAVALAACAPHGEGPQLRGEAEAISFQAPTMVIPHADSSEEAPPPPVVEDEPCETEEVEPQPVAEPERPRVRGRMRPRTAGKPVRKMGKKAATPF